MKSYASTTMPKISYFPLPNSELVDIYLRKELPQETGSEGEVLIVYDEVYLRVNKSLTRSQVEEDFEALFSQSKVEPLEGEIGLRALRLSSLREDSTTTTVQRDAPPLDILLTKASLYFVANKSNTTFDFNDWTFYADELAYSDTDKFYPKFEGTYSDYNEVASDDQTKYTWKIIKADDGIGIKSVKEYYAVSASNVTPPSLPSDWSETPKATDTTNKYLWNYEVYTYSNGDVKETTKRVIGTHGTTGATGASGQSVTSITEEYYLSTSKTSQTGGSWKATPDPWASGKYQWTRSKIMYTNPTKTEYTNPVIDTSWEAIDGIQVGQRNLLLNSSNFNRLSSNDGSALPIQKGTDSIGNWISGYRTTNPSIFGLSIYFPVYTDATCFSPEAGKLSPTEDRVVWSTEVMSSSPINVSITGGQTITLTPNVWQRVSGKYIAQTRPPVLVSTNTDVPATAKLYHRNWKLEKGTVLTDWSPALEDTQQAIDSKVTETDVEYYLSTSSTTPTGGTWVTTAPPWVDGKFMWSRTKIVYGNGTTRYAPSETGTCIAGATGNTGNGIVSVTNRYLATTLATGVTTATSGWTTAVQATDSVKKYLWNYEEILYTNGTKIPTTPVIIGTHGEKGDNSVIGLLTNESITLPANKDGLVSSFVGATGIFDVYDGVTKKTGLGVTYSLVSQSNITVTINATTGAYSVTAMPTGTTVLNGFAVLRAVYSGVTIEKQLNVAKAVTGATGSTGATGNTGASATSYWITASNNIIGKSQTGVINPTTITFKGFSKTGTANSVAYAGRFIVQTSTNGTTYTTRYTSSANQSTYTYTIPTDSLFVKCLFYMAGGTTVLLDEQTVPIVESAEGIQVGGRNLVTSTATLDDMTDSQKANGVRLEEDRHMGNLSIKRTFVSGNADTYHQQTSVPMTGKEYVVTFWAKADRPLTFWNYLYNPDTITSSTNSDGYKSTVANGGSALQATTEWKKYWIKWTQNSSPSKKYLLLGRIQTAGTVWINSPMLVEGNVPVDWQPAPEDARTYKAWANSSDGTVDFTRVYPNENLVVLGNAQDNKGITWALGVEYTRPGAMLTDYIEVSALENITTSRATTQLALYNQNKEYLSSMPSSLLSFFIPSNGTSWTNKPSTLPTDTDPKYLRATYDGVQVSDTEAKVKLERGTTPTIYTTNTADSLTGSVMQYIGFSPLDSNKPSDYEWIINPEWTERKSQEGLNGKEGAIMKQPNAPQNPAVGLIWVNTTKPPNIPYRWTGTEWVKLTATEASDIGAFSDSDGSDLINRMSSAEQLISSDSITNTVLSSEDFASLFDSKANSADLEDFATTTQLADQYTAFEEYVKKEVGDTYNPLFDQLSKLEQTVGKFDFKIQQAGGVNMLRNSLGFAGLDFWGDEGTGAQALMAGGEGEEPTVYAVSNGTTTTVQNNELASLGFGSGFLHKADDARIIQQVMLPAQGTYTLSFYMDKVTTTGTQGGGGVEIYAGGQKLAFVGAEVGVPVENFTKYAYTFETDALDIYIHMVAWGNANTEITMSGLMLNIGDLALVWQPYPAEIYNTNVLVDINGITVKNNQTNGYTLITPSEFSGYAQVGTEMRRIFTLNGQTTEVEEIAVRSKITMGPISILSISTPTNTGWAFIG